MAEELHFARTTRSTQLACAGELPLDHVRPDFAVLQQASDSVKAANDFKGKLCITLFDGITPSRLPALMAAMPTCHQLRQFNQGHGKRHFGELRWNFGIYAVLWLLRKSCISHGLRKGCILNSPLYLAP
ncbi:hypothetical protein [Pectobacterium cacticida]